MEDYVFGRDEFSASIRPWWERIEFTLLHSFAGEHPVGWLDERSMQWYDEIWMIQSGQCMVRLDNGKTFIAEAGDAMVLTAGSARYTSNPLDIPLKVVGVCFLTSLLADKQVLSRFKLPTILRMKTPHLELTLEQIVRELRESQIAYNFVAPGLTQLAIAELMRAAFPEGEASTQFHQRLLANSTYGPKFEVAAVLHFIENSFSQPIDVEDMAHVAHLSVGHFAMRFKAEVGLTPMVYLRLYRLHQAFDKLITTDMTVAQIAFDCGMDDPAYFSRAFKAHYKRTPLEVRRTRVSATPPFSVSELSSNIASVNKIAL